MYYRGNLILDYSSGGTWTSSAHTSGQTSNLYLYYNSGGFVWSNSSWDFFDVQIAIVYNDIFGFKFAQREVHGLMDCEAHQALHFSVGTFKRSGGDFSGWIANSSTVGNRRPDISSTRISDEDLTSNLDVLTAETYTRFYLSGTNAFATFVTGSTDIVALNVNVPFYNQFTGTIWQQTPMSNNAYQAVFVLAVPVASDILSKEYKYLFVQGQSQSTTLATIQALTTDSVNLGTFGSSAPEFVFIGKIILRYVGPATNNWQLISIQSLTGSRFNQVAAPSGNYLSSVNTDSTLIGDGTPTNLLGVNPNLLITSISATTFTLGTFESVNKIATGTTDNDYIATKGYVDDNGGSGDLYERRSDYVHSALTSYQGYAISGSSTSDAVWIINKTAADSIGNVTANTQTANYIWDNRYSL
jgi:hypothetical protein